MSKLVWPGLLIALLVGSAGANLAMVALANADPGFSTPRNYYDKAVHWDEVREQAVRNQELGWRVAVASRVQQDLTLTVQVYQSGGAPLAGAHIEVEAYPIARGNRVVESVAREVSGGIYELRLPSLQRGLWDVTVTIQQGDQTFREVVRHEVM